MIKNFGKRAAGKYLKKWGFNNKGKDVCVCEREREWEKKSIDHNVKKGRYNYSFKND